MRRLGAPSFLALLLPLVVGLGCDSPTPPPVADAGSEIPTPIRYVLVILKENHTFDNYFTGFPGATSSPTATLSDGGVIVRPEAPDGPLPEDLCHTNGCGQVAYRDGGMDGFDLNVSPPNSELPFIAYSEAQIPNYWAYARDYVLVDHMFSAVLGPSTPGHIVLWTAQPLVIDNPFCIHPGGGACGGSGCRAGADVRIEALGPDDCTVQRVPPCFDVPSLTDHLPPGFTWVDYQSPDAMLIASVADGGSSNSHFRTEVQLVEDFDGGTLANLMIAPLDGAVREPDGGRISDSVSEHPPQDPCPGENFTVELINAAMKRPEWKHMAIIVTWDDSGGFYDSVAPPVRVCPDGQIYERGFRLPALIISPYAKKGYVLSTPTNQASIPKLIEDLWGMKYMSTRDPRALDGSAGSLMSAFDFSQPPRPPTLLQERTCP